MNLSSYNFGRSYHKPADDLAQDFYLPALEASVSYDRAVGFFSSTIFIIAWSSLKAFAKNGGKMRLICSPILSEGDHEALREGYSRKLEESTSQSLCQSFQDLLDNDTFHKPAVVLASLVAEGIIDCKIAWIGKDLSGRPRRLFHDKLGILTDKVGNKIAFKGSMNETWPALSQDGNLESVDVFASWRDEGEQARVSDEANYFDQLWDNAYPGVEVHPFPETARNKIISSAEAGHWPELVDEICLELEEAARWSPDASRMGGRKPRPHQIQALDEWERQGRRGVFKHATGSGKTFTALCAIGDALSRNEVPLILVPGELLLDQWLEEIKGTFEGSNLAIMVCGGGHNKWRKNNNLRRWTRSNHTTPRAVLSTIQTASGSEFLSQISQGEHIFLVADEVHRLGATKAQNILTTVVGPRLGLSATPERAGDPTGTKAIFDYFGPIVPPVFGLKEAIAAKALTPYFYNVHTVRLTSDEGDQWRSYSKRIQRVYARILSGGDEEGVNLSRQLQNLLIQRARIVKSAEGKTELAAQVLKENFSDGQRWIVYCDDQSQMHEVTSSAKSGGLKSVFEYHSEMEGDKQETLKFFSERGGIVVSIRCLDEGVDIPSVTHALILASSKNPREFVQRRGRVLRRHAQKNFAHLHDVLVLPETDDEDQPEVSFLKGELARAIEFGSNAQNPAAVFDLKRIAAQAGVAWEDLTTVGFEDDEEEAEASE
ncbi:Superfamily II DNA or RNA helicase [Poseidonocella sedimentorum]|uniref:Superfamily II DNA or RNA helicase n=1 Tax=Poseidonocella sedimentorum TaxID=871652 RepID=A0A1I6CMQ3_9RHOB|nr:Superfamily II DNA or RNA helicase [Poseidonocella sedimentorum]